MTDKKFIEESFPVKEVSEFSAKERNIRHGHISTLHIWWTRKPLGSSRATSYAALIPAPENIDEWDKTRQFIINLSKWENSLDPYIIKKAREDILRSNGGKAPRVLDPFSGGGSIPLEALRLGCETHAVDYNPVAVLLLKCTLEYPQKYGKGKEVEEETKLGRVKLLKNPLLEDVKRWGEWVLEEAKQEIGKFYPEDNDGSIPVGYYWMRTIPCQNPVCGAEIPLTANWWLAKKKNKKRVSLNPYVEGKEVRFRIVGDGYEAMPDGFDPSKGTVSRAIATCPVCGSTVEKNTTRRLFQEGKAGERMVAVVLHKPKTTGKRYRLATEKDIEIFREAENYLKEKRQKLMEEYGFDPVPDEVLKRVPVTFGVINVWVYGMNKWGDLFNARQKLALITFVEKVRLAYKKMIEQKYDKEYAKAVVSYLGLILGKLADKTSSLCRWLSTSEQVVGTFSRQALPMIWDYGEFNLLTNNFVELLSNTIYHFSQTLSTPATIPQSSATFISYPDNYKEK